MIEPIIITFWLEFNDRLQRKTISKVFHECEPIVVQLYEYYEKKPQKLVAVKCDSFREYLATRNYFKKGKIKNEKDK